MTVRINKNALNLREELTKAQSVVPYSQQQFWMDGLVENGTFDVDTSGWTAGTGATIAAVSGELEVTSSSTYAGAQFNFTVEVGKTYIISADIRRGTSSTATLGINNVGWSVLVDYGNTTNETVTATFTAKSVNAYILIASHYGNGTVYADNVAVFEVDENDEVIHSLPLGWKPLHVYEDGLIQREGDVHDYTVVKTGGAYAIKPAVQPTGATETCVIAEREL